MDIVLGVIGAVFLIGLVPLLVWARRTERDLPEPALADSQTTDEERRARQFGIGIAGPQSTCGR